MIDIKGSGDVLVNVLVIKSVEAAIHGSGDIKRPSLQASRVNITVNVSGDIFAASNTDVINIEVMGSGDIRTARLITREAGVKLMSSSEVALHASEELTASVHGSGDVRFAGSLLRVTCSETAARQRVCESPIWRIIRVTVLLHRPAR